MSVRVFFTISRSYKLLEAAAFSVIKSWPQDHTIICRGKKKSKTWSKLFLNTKDSQCMPLIIAPWQVSHSVKLFWPNVFTFTSKSLSTSEENLNEKTPNLLNKFDRHYSTWRNVISWILIYEGFKRFSFFFFFLCCEMITEHPVSRWSAWEEKAVSSQLLQNRPNC